MGVDAKSVKTCLIGLAVGGGLALLTQMGLITPPSVIAPGGGFAITGGEAADGTGEPAQEERPANFAAYEAPSFMTAVYEGKFDSTGFRDTIRRAAYSIEIADVIRQTCRGPFTTAEVEGWRNKASRQVLRNITPENGLKAMENFMRGMGEVYKNPERLADADTGMPSDEELNMKAQQDGMTFIQEHSCNGAVFEQFTTNLKQAAQSDVGTQTEGLAM